MSKQYEQLSGTPYKMIMQAGMQLGFPNELFLHALTPRECHQETIHITMGNKGSKLERIFPSFRLVVNFLRKFQPSQGGIKISHDIFYGHQYGESSYVNPAKLHQLAIEMAIKHMILQTGKAGAKAAIEVPIIDIRNHPDLIGVLLHKWGRDAGSQILDPFGGGVGPDTQTGDKMSFIYEGLIDSNRFSKQKAAACVTAKPLAIGGIEIRDKSTGIGVAFAVIDQIKTLFDLGKLSGNVENVRIVFQGAGAVGRSAMEYLIGLKKYKIIAFSSLSDQDTPDNTISLFCEDGFTIDQLKNIINSKGQVIIEQVKKDRQIVVQYSGEGIFDVKAEIFVPAARERSITAKHIASTLLQSVLGILEAANMPLTEDAYNILDKRKVLYYIGPTVNSLGVGASDLERRNALLGITTTYDEQFQGLQKFWANIKMFREEALTRFPCITGDLTTSIYLLIAHQIATERTRNIEASKHMVT